MSRKKTSQMENYIRSGVADRLRKIRGSRSQKEFAQLIGISQQKVSNFERGILLPSIPTLIRIARESGVYIDWLLTGEGPMRPPVTRDLVLRTRIESDKEGFDLYEVIEEISGKATVVTKEEMDQIHKLLRILKGGDAKLVEAVKSCLREFERLSGLISAHFGDIILLERRVRQIPIDFPDRRKSEKQSGGMKNTSA